MLCFTQSLISALEEGDGEALEDIDDWEQEEIGTTKELVKDWDGRFVEAPTKYHFHEYRHMERFIETVEDADKAQELWKAIRGNGAFRYFKGTADRPGLLQRWFQFRNSAMKELTTDWAAAYAIEIDDETQPGPDPGCALPTVVRFVL